MKQCTTIFALFFLLINGCSTSPDIADAKGQVTYDGEAVTNGIVSFINVENSKCEGGAFIEEGRYRLYPEVGLKPGEYRVEIRWSKPTGEKRPATYGISDVIFAEAIPEKYNSESHLKVKLKTGENQIDFILEK